MFQDMNIIIMLLQSIEHEVMISDYIIYTDASLTKKS